ncbi:MAG: RNA polymerase subunit sigma [Desulfocapsa sp.]|nr:MAG: RNA polymerase subunit sigma [Desulfocapsa sp.]
MVVEEKAAHDAVEWLNLYGDALYRFALFRVQDSFIAEDMVQETLLAAYGSYKNFSGKSTVKTWLTGILKHKILDYYRKATPEQNDDNLDDFASSSGSMFDEKEKWKIKPEDWKQDPKNVFEHKELMAVITACIAGLPVKMSLVYRMRELEGATTSEICERFETGESNCWVILHRARLLIRRCLEINWFAEDKKRV